MGGGNVEANLLMHKAQAEKKKKKKSTIHYSNNKKTN